MIPVRLGNLPATTFVDRGLGVYSLMPAADLIGIVTYQTQNLDLLVNVNIRNRWRTEIIPVRVLLEMHGYEQGLNSPIVMTVIERLLRLLGARLVGEGEGFPLSRECFNTSRVVLEADDCNRVMVRPDSPGAMILGKIEPDRKIWDCEFVFRSWQGGYYHSRNFSLNLDGDAVSAARRGVEDIFSYLGLLLVPSDSTEWAVQVLAAQVERP